MIIHQRFRATCRGCKKRFDIFEYEGLVGGRYASHSCSRKRDRERLYRTPDKLSLYTNIRKAVYRAR